MMANNMNIEQPLLAYWLWDWTAAWPDQAKCLIQQWPEKAIILLVPFLWAFLSNLNLQVRVLYDLVSTTIAMNNAVHMSAPKNLIVIKLGDLLQYGCILHNPTIQHEIQYSASVILLLQVFFHSYKISKQK